MQESFGKSPKVLILAALSFPYLKVKSEKTLKINLDGKDCVMEEGTHFKIII